MSLIKSLPLNPVADRQIIKLLSDAGSVDSCIRSDLTFIANSLCATCTPPAVFIENNLMKNQKVVQKIAGL